MAEPQPATQVCRNCGQPLSGRFCAQCGEEALEHDALTIRHFVAHTVVHDILHLEGKTWQTLRELFVHPGRLAIDYCAVRRKAYVSPVRLLITAIVVYALLTGGGLQISLFIGHVALSIAPAAAPHGASVRETIKRIDRFEILNRMMAIRGASADLESEAVREKFNTKLEKFAEPLSFANVLLLALVLYALLRRRRRLFLEHAAFAAHFLSFVLLSSLMFLSVRGLLVFGGETVALAIIGIGIIWQFVYLTVAIRRFYLADDTRRLRPVLKAAAVAAFIYIANSAFVTAVQLVGGALALLTI